MERWEVGSLFLGVEEERAHQSWIAGIKYLVNHFFEMYGVEVWAFIIWKCSKTLSLSLSLSL